MICALCPCTWPLVPGTIEGAFSFGGNQGLTGLFLFTTDEMVITIISFKAFQTHIG